MKSIKNIPLTRTIDLDLNIVEERKIKLADSDIENENLKKKLKKIVEVASKIKGVIVTGGRGEEQFVMANITPSKKKDKTLIFPEPNPVLIYYNCGVEHIKNTISIRENILKYEYAPEELFAVFSEFYKEAFQGLTQMIMSLESLFNQKIPEEINLEFEGQILNKEKIEWKDFKTKLRHLIPKLTGIDLYEKYNFDYQNVCKLNSLRNNLIHLKSLRQENFTYYQSLCKELIDFEYEKSCNSVRNTIKLLQ